MATTDLTKLDNTKGILLSERSNEAIKQIKAKLRKTAQTIIEIGELLVKAIDNEPAEYKKEFYKQLGMSERSGQRYMQIAKSEAIQKLKSDEPKLLEKMTLSDLENKIRENNKTKSDTNSNESLADVASRRAENIYRKYKNNPETLKEIIENLQKMLEEEQKS